MSHASTKKKLYDNNDTSCNRQWRSLEHGRIIKYHTWRGKNEERNRKERKRRRTRYHHLIDIQSASCAPWGNQRQIIFSRHTTLEYKHQSKRQQNRTLWCYWVLPYAHGFVFSVVNASNFWTTNIIWHIRLICLAFVLDATCLCRLILFERCHVT